MPGAGVIDDARARQRRRRGHIAATMLVALLAGGAAILGGGSGGGSGRSVSPAGGSWSSVSIGKGISVSYPHGWHLLKAPITSLTYPYDRVLLTSYPAASGGGCSPTRAENALPPNGALIFLLEYAAAPGSVFGRPKGMEFPPQSAGFTLRPRDLANYECWRVPGYLMRFSAAGRLFQVHVAFGAGAAASRRAQALLILRRLRIRGLDRVGLEAVPRSAH
jgi:hypothetical protein